MLLIVCAWAAGVIFFTTAPWLWVRSILALAFFAFAVWALCLRPTMNKRIALAGMLLAVVAWFFSLWPSHDREWRDTVTVMPRAIIDGDRVRITGYRDFDFRAADEFDVRYEERDVSLADLTSVDFYISYWSTGPMGHTFLSFNFDNAEPVCVSIEARLERDEGFSPIGSIFKRHELVYVVGSERDQVRWRSNFRDEDVYLYPIRIEREAALRLFRVYLDRVNELADHPEWYHLLKNNCGLNIIRYANAAGRQGRFDLRHLLNGWMDRYFFEAGLIDTSLPFDELRAGSRINDAALEADDARDFSARIRSRLPGAAN